MKKKSQRQSQPAAEPVAAAAACRLSVCVIARDEAGRLGRCLTDAAAAADELIVVDTGSTDATKAEAAACGARVFDFPWSGDFSAARNASLAQATGDYILWLDADDRLDASEAEKLRRLKARLPREKNLAYYLTVKDESAVRGDTFFAQLRLFPNRPEARFEWRIHEQISRPLQAAGVELTGVEITIRHTGNHSAAEIRRKSERNLEIITAELAAHPGEPVLHFHAARTHANLDHWTEALAHLDTVIRNPNFSSLPPALRMETLYLEGRYAVAANDLVRAETAIRACAAGFPGQMAVEVLLGECLCQLGRFGEAAAVLAATLPQAPGIGTLPLNLSALRFSQHYWLARAQLELGRSEEAKNGFLRALDFLPEDGRALQELALLGLMHQDYASAVAYYERLAAAGQASEGTYSNLGLAYRKLGRDAKAEQSYLKALGINPERLEPLTNLGYLYLDRKDEARALNCFQQAVRLDAHLTDVQLTLAGIYSRRRDYDLVVAQAGSLLEELHLPLARTLDSLDDLAGLFGEIGETLEGQGRTDPAFLAYQTALAVRPQAAILPRLFALADRAGRWPECRRLLQDVAAQHAHDPEALALLKSALESAAAVPAGR